jgi:hypothetical protein
MGSGETSGTERKKERNLSLKKEIISGRDRRYFSFDYLRESKENIETAWGKITSMLSERTL